MTGRRASVDNVVAVGDVVVEHEEDEDKEK